MEAIKIGIATALINGLADPPYYFDEKCYFAWDITFSDSSAIFVNHIPYIYVGDTMEEAVEVCNQIKDTFKEAFICDNDRVALIFDEADGKVRAIGSIGKDFWIDIEDHFKTKTFNDLNLIIDSLSVF